MVALGLDDVADAVEREWYRASMQPDLFSQPPAQRHSPESVEAAERIKPRVFNLRERVYDIIASNGPLTDEHIATISGLSLNTVRPRRVELLNAGRIHKADVSRTRSGRKAAAWGVTLDA